jgi:hypothetical protein
MLDFLARKHFQVTQKGGGLAAPVRLDDSAHDIDAFGAQLLRGDQHGVGLADAGGITEKNLQLALLRLLVLLGNAREQLVGIGAGVLAGVPHGMEPA